MSRTLRIGGDSGYDVIIGRRLLDGCPIAAPEGASKVLVVSDSNVFPLYGEKTVKMLEGLGLEVSSFVFSAGEVNKNLNTYSRILDAAVSAGLTRRDLFAALGGGVTGDLCGFAAATYLRGVRYIQIPTTLLAAVDSSVGGKTGIDLPGGKNLAGAFHRPCAVICDTATLDTLPDEQYRNGCAEIIKYGMIGSQEFLNRLEKMPVIDNYEETIAFCVKMKLEFVEIDEFDVGCRMLLNFGHTFGHAAEKCSKFTLPHGFGVAIGMAAVTRAAVAQGICGAEVYDKLVSLLEKYNLPHECRFTLEEMLEAASADKKSDGKKINLIVPDGPGSCRIMPVGKDKIADWMRLGGIKSEEED